MCANRIMRCCCAAAMLVIWPVGCAKGPAVNDAEPTPVPFKPAISGPYTHDNLTVYLMHSPGVYRGGNLLTLQEALAQEKLRVHETGSVNELAVENRSRDQDVFIQAGEIVRGGKQDRVLAVDVIIGPQSGQVPIAAFCVEQGRWHSRGGEASQYFSSSDNSVSSNSMKLAIRVDNSQGVVWENVAKDQQRLGASVGENVADAMSATSLELSMESDAVQRNSAEYTDILLGAIEDRDDVLGLVVAINGKLYNADVYASSGLFHKLWPKLLEAAAIEALASRTDERSSTLPTTAEVLQFLNAAEDGKASTRQVSSRVSTVTRESGEYTMFEMVDNQGDPVWIHRSYIRK
ncbi:MAG: DUF6569 family protein [Planctomycetota bacterium]